MKSLFRQNDDKSMDAIAKWLRKHYTEDISPESLARQFHMTSSQISRRFYDAFQVSPINYAIDLRIRKAMELMENGKLPPEEAAGQAGFEDYEHFRALFVSRTSMTPGQYLEELAGGPAAEPSGAPEKAAPAEDTGITGEDVPGEDISGEDFPDEVVPDEDIPGEDMLAAKETGSEEITPEEITPEDITPEDIEPHESESPEALQAWAEEVPGRTAAPFSSPEESETDGGPVKETAETALPAESPES